MSVVLNGSTQNLSVASQLGLGNQATSFYTMSFWFKRSRTAFTSIECIGGRGDPSSSTNYADIRIPSGAGNQIQVSRFAGAADALTVGVVDETTGWHNVIGVYAPADGVNRPLVGALDGTDASLNSTRSSTASSPTFYIGRRGGAAAAYRFGGKIAHVAVWNAALTTAEFAELQTKTPDAIAYSGGLSGANLVAYWPLLDDPLDDVGGFHLTETGTPTYDTEDNPTLSGSPGGSSEATYLIVPRRQLFVARRVFQH